MSEGKPAPLQRTLLYLTGLAIPTVVAFYLGIFLKGDLDLEYYRESRITAHRGKVMVDPDHEVELQVDQVFYQGQATSDVDLVRFSLVNDDWQSLSKGAEFYFRTGDRPIPGNCILGVKPSTMTSTGALVQLERTEHPDLGVGLRLESDLPAYARLQIGLVLRADCDIADPQIAKKYRGRERLAAGSDPSQAMITLPLWNAILWLVAVACLYSVSWLLMNIYLCNFSTGARILDFLLRKATGWSIIEWAECRQQPPADAANE